MKWWSGVRINLCSLYMVRKIFISSFKIDWPFSIWISMQIDLTFGVQTIQVRHLNFNLLKFRHWQQIQASVHIQALDKTYYHFIWLEIYFFQLFKLTDHAQFGALWREIWPLEYGLSKLDVKIQTLAANLGVSSHCNIRKTYAHYIWLKISFSWLSKLTNYA